MDSAAIAWVERFLALRGEVRDVVEVALTRLSLARRRFKAGDKALDGSICLEALFGDSQGEMTHKITVRAARTLRSTLADRRDVAQAIKAFYKLRSKVAHGRLTSMKETEQYEIAKTGLDLALEAARITVTTGALFNTMDVDLG